MVLPDTFEGEDVIITFEKEYDSTVDSSDRTTAIQNVEGRILSWSQSGGAENTEDVYAFNGVTFNFSKPREKYQLSFDVMVNSSDFDLVQLGSSDSGARINATMGKIMKSSDPTKRWRVILWFQDSSYHKSRTVAAAGGNKSYKITVPAKNQPLYRMIFCDCKSVTFDKEFSADEYMKGTLTLEFSATDANGYANYFEEAGLYTGTTSTNLKSMTTTASSGILLEAKGYLDWATTTANWYAGSTTTHVAKRYRYTG